MFLIILNISTIVLLLISLLSLLVGFNNFISSQFMMLSYYLLSPHADNNERVGIQFEFLSQFRQNSIKANKVMCLSLLALGVIILLRYLIEVMLYAYL